MAEENKTFPNIPVSHWHNLRAQFKKSIPGTASPNYLASVLNMSVSSARTNIIPSLKLIGFLDNDLNTNQEMARKFRDDDQYPKLCDEILKKNYPQEIRDAFPDKTSDRERIKSWFMNHSGIGQSLANRTSSFYVSLLEVDPNVTLTSKTPKAISTTKKEAPKTAPSSKPKNVELRKPEPTNKDDGNNHGQRGRTPDLNINVQIHISSDASSDQIEQIFKNMSKYIFKDS